MLYNKNDLYFLTFCLEYRQACHLLKGILCTAILNYKFCSLSPARKILMLKATWCCPASTCSGEVEELYLMKQTLGFPLWQMGMSKTNFQA